LTFTACGGGSDKKLDGPVVIRDTSAADAATPTDGQADTGGSGTDAADGPRDTLPSDLRDGAQLPRDGADGTASDAPPASDGPMGSDTASSPGTMTVGPGGGTIVSADGRLTLVVPPGALTRLVVFSIQPTTDVPAGALGPAYAVGPPGTTFAVPAQVIFKPAAADFAGVDLATVQVAQHPVGGGWINLADLVSDTGAGTVRGNTSGVSSFGLIAGLCDTCLATCTAATCTIGAVPGMPGTGVPGRCAAFGRGCLRCVPTCDSDGDGFCPGSPANGPGGDCDDGNARVNPEAREVCGNGIDDNCNGHQDEGCRACTSDAECPSGLEACLGGVCKVCEAFCTLDNCRFGVIEGMPNSGVVGRCATVGRGCLQCVPACDMDGDGFCPGPTVMGQEGGDCNDAAPKVSPALPEICGNMIDDDCDGQIDEGCTTCANDPECPVQQKCVAGLCVLCPAACDPATCRFGATPGMPNTGVAGQCATQGNGCSVCVPTCDTDGDGFCPGNPGNGQDGGDCNDNDRNRNPSATEVCGNGVDDNCNGHEDEGCRVCQQDAECPSGLEACLGNLCQVCDGSCDANNCRFGVRDTPPTSPGVAGHCFAFGRGCNRCVPDCDTDGDGFCPGMPGNDQPGGDCDDANPKAHPGATEICGNGIDDDCNGAIDEGCQSCRTAADMCGMTQSCSSGR
jgi:hypothetical protein